MNRLLIPLLLLVSSLVEGANDANLNLQHNQMEECTVPIICTPSEFKYMFTMKVTDLPKPTHALFDGTKMDGQHVTFPVYINEKGDVLIGDGTERYLHFGGIYGYGEWLDIEIIPRDKQGNPLKTNQVKAAHRLVFHPLQVSDSSGRKMIIEPLDDTGCFFAIKLLGFESGEEVVFVSRSCDEELIDHIRIDERAPVIIYAPAVVGRKQGPFEITIQMKNRDPLVIQHYWGKLAFTPIDTYEKVIDRYPKFKKKM